MPGVSPTPSGANAADQGLRQRLETDVPSAEKFQIELTIVVGAADSADAESICTEALSAANGDVDVVIVEDGDDEILAVCSEQTAAGTTGGSAGGSSSGAGSTGGGSSR